MSSVDKTLPRMKVVLAGLEGTGTKTSLLRRMVLGVFDDDLPEISEPYHMEKIVEVDDAAVTMEFWGLLHRDRCT